MNAYSVDDRRYDQMPYRRCGNSGLLLPEVSLGFWQHFSNENPYSQCRHTVLRAFDLGVTHFDFANNYGNPPGSAEIIFGRILKEDLSQYRDELIVTTKAGYYMWPGPYGEWGSRKYLIASINQSLKRLGLDYIDIFYAHREDPNTPLEETMDAMAQIVKQGKALYVGISNFSPDNTIKAIEILKSMGVHCLVHQVKYSMFDREPENGLLNILDKYGIGCVAYQVLAQGLLSDKYLNGIPNDSRLAKGLGALDAKQINANLLRCLSKLNLIAVNRGQSLAQMAIAWTLKNQTVTSVILGASRTEHLENNILALNKKRFADDELIEIDNILNEYTKANR